LKMDVTDPASVKSAISAVLQKENRIDVLVNNAGMGISGAIEDCLPQDVRLQMETNFMGYVNTIREVLPAMRAQGSGTIINISSIGGLMGLPFQGFYSASKYAVEGFSEALRMEVEPFNIKVVLVNPGDFHTRFTANRVISLTVVNSPAYGKAFNKAISAIEKDENGGLLPEVLASKLLKIIESKNPRSRYIVSTFEQKLAVFLKVILPSKLFDKILSSHYGLK
jgi:short-subunit dehydrogenase